MFEVSRHIDVLYPGIDQLAKTLIANFGTAKKCTTKVVCEPGGMLCELVVSSIYYNQVIFEIPNGKGGHRYLHLSYEQVEYPAGSIAARACAMNDAQALYPIDEKMGENKKRKQEALRRQHVEEHWHDFYDNIVQGSKVFYERQKASPQEIDWKHMWLTWVGEFVHQLQDAKTRILELDANNAALKTQAKLAIEVLQKLL